MCHHTKRTKTRGFHSTLRNHKLFVIDLAHSQCPRMASNLIQHKLNRRSNGTKNYQGTIMTRPEIVLSNGKSGVIDNCDEINTEHEQ